MPNPQAPSLLDYARFHGISCDSTALDPLTYIDETCNVASETPPLPQNTLSDFQDYIYETQKSVESSLRKEKLNVRKESARLLSSVVQQAKAEKLDTNWNDLLPKFNRIDELKVEIPILSTESILDTLPFTGPLRYNEKKIAIRPLDETSQSLKDEDIKADLLAKVDKVLGDGRTEKLRCRKESMLLIQNAKGCGEVPFAGLESLLWHVIMPSQGDQTTLNSPPFLLSDVNDTYYRSPSPVAMSSVLPSPSSSDCFGIELQRNRESVYDPTSETSDCMIVAHRLKASHLDEEVIYKNGQTAEVSEPEIGITNCARISQSSPDGHSWHELQVPDTSGETHGPFHSIDSDSPLNCPMPDYELVQTTDPATQQEREGRVPRAIPADEKCQITSILAGSHFSSSPSVSSSPLQANSVECRGIRPSSTSNMSSSQLNIQSHMSDDLKEVENLVESVSGKPSESPFKDIGDTENAEQLQLLQRNIASPQPESDKMSLPKSSTANESDTTTSSNTVSSSKDRTFLAKRSPEKQKRRHEEREDISRKDRKIDRHTTTSLLNDKGNHKLSLQSSILGSLSTFMETRCRIERRPVTAISPYFTSERTTEIIPEHQNQVMDTSDPYQQQDEAKNTTSELRSIEQELTKQRYPLLQSQNHTQPLLVLSTALLKTHLSIVQSLERMKDPPAVIYRDYDGPIKSHQTNTLPREADIIISPTTGIILTTLQATTQLHLPGHKPSSQTNGIKCVNSPLRERIFLLARRYKHLYVFVSHGPSSPKSAQGNLAPWIADRKVLSSYTSLMAFCDSMSVNSTISPILVPRTPETTIGWILALAQKHFFQLPTSTLGISQSMAFAPVNRPPKVKFDIESMEKETRWELFLRRVGLNPYAAQAILTVLGKENACLEYNKVITRDNADNRISALSRFIEMPSERRQEVFRDLVGENTNALIESDWQCDWALEF